MRASGCDFIHLHVHSDNSLLDGAAAVPKLVQRARALGMPALALTDHGNLFGAIDFYRECTRHGVKPILGMEAYVAPGNRRSKAKDPLGQTAYHLTLLCRNEKGYRNLLKLSTLSYREGYYYRARIDHELLERHHDGLIALSGCPQGEFGYRCARGNFDDALSTAKQYVDLFGKEHYFLEIQQHHLDIEKKVTEGALRAARALGLKVVATNDCHYIHREDAEAHDVLLALATGSRLDDPNRLRFDTPEFYLKSAEEMHALFGHDLPEALRASVEIAEMCNVEIPFGELHIPTFPTENGEPPAALLRRRCEQGLRCKQISHPERARARMEQEVKVIERKGLASYFLIVSDFVEYARRRGIPVGPGRGSAAGSLVAYLLGITDIDPLRYGLLFERFLNPERHEMPDIDIDFAPEGRSRVIDYIRSRYGTERVSQIVTFHVMKARAVIRDVARVLGLPLATADRIAKRIPRSQILNIRLEDVLRRDPELAQLVRSDENIRKLWSIATRLEDLRRHSSRHAGGVVISDRPLWEYCPLFVRDQDEITQYDMESLAALGLLKMDLLGVETLSILDRTVKLVRKTRGQEIVLRNIPLDDPDPFSLLSRGRVKGIFQLEVSRAAREMVVRLKPTRIEDLMALVALNRPGPMQSGMADSFINRKNGLEKVTYPHPRLEGILEETHGAILYQEQVMLIAHELAGFSLAEADKLRKAMGKKIPALMEEYAGKFFEGCAKNGIDKGISEKIWSDISKFAGYGFNKSHSTAYGLIAYRTAYMKAKYPQEFMSVLMTSNLSREDKLIGYIEECRQLGIPVLPPSIQESEWGFLPTEDGKIRMGLGAVKGVGERAVEDILRARREVGGRFESFEQFLEKIDLRLVEKRAIDALIRAGAFDPLGESRACLAENYERILEIVGNRKRQRERDLFGGITGEDAGFQPLRKVGEWPEEVLLAREKEALGFYITSNPVARYAKLMQRLGARTLEELTDGEAAGGSDVTVGVILSNVRLRVVQSGRNRGSHYVIFDVMDLTGRCEAVMFAGDLEKNRRHLVEDAIVLLEGSVDFRSDDPSLIARRVEPIEEVLNRLERLELSLDLREVSEEALDRVRGAIRKHPGRLPVQLDVVTRQGNAVRLEIPADRGVTPDSALLSELETVLGPESVKLRQKPREGDPASPHRRRPDRRG